MFASEVICIIKTRPPRSCSLGNATEGKATPATPFQPKTVDTTLAPFGLALGFSMTANARLLEPAPAMKQLMTALEAGRSVITPPRREVVVRRAHVLL